MMMIMTGFILVYTIRVFIMILIVIMIINIILVVIIMIIIIIITTIKAIVMFIIISDITDSENNYGYNSHNCSPLGPRDYINVTT